MAEYLPSELQHAILGNLMHNCAKGLAFKTMIQESWFKISLKRLDKTLNTRSQETFDSEMVRLFLTIDELSNLTDDMRLKIHRELINLHWRSKDQIDKARRWMIAYRNITLNKLRYLTFALQRQYHYMTRYISSDDQLFVYLLLKDELPKYQVQELLCAYKTPDLHFIPTSQLYLDDNSTRHYIKDKNLYQIILGDRQLFEQDAKKIVLQFPTQYSNWLLC